MMSLCLRYSKNEEDALDVLNTGFLKVFKNIYRYDAAKASLYTWMRTIIINTCLDFVRVWQKEPITGELDHAENIQVAPEVISRMGSDELLQMVRQLPPATQAVFNLYIIEGFSHKEIGTLLGISDGTCKWHLSEARKKLKVLFNAQ